MTAGQSLNSTPQSLSPLCVSDGCFHPTRSPQGPAEEVGPALASPGHLQVEHSVVPFVGAGGCYSDDQ